MIQENYPEGISVVLCCYNSEGRLNNTLMALSRQQVMSDTDWEVILIDNASTDNTAREAERIWAASGSVTPMNIFQESTPGLNHARKKGISAARFSFLVFCDDDNWFANDYIQKSFSILKNNPDAAACGGLGSPVFETQKPAWFDEYAEAYAVGRQDSNLESGKLVSLYGAGLAIRKESLDYLQSIGFESFLVGRTGNNLSSAEDTEISYALVLAGYDLIFSPELRFDHYLPKKRLTFEYLQHLFTAFGSDGPIRNVYYAAISKRFIHRQLKYWPVHFMLSVVRLVKYGIVPPKRFGRRIYFSWNIAYIRQLISLRPQYAALKKNIQRIQSFNKIH